MSVMSKLSGPWTICFLTGLLIGGTAAAEPFVPVDDTMVLERLPAAKDSKIAELRRLHAGLARQPDNLNLAIAVAQRDVAAARALFDPRFNGYAEAALAPWWGLPDPPAPVRLLRATIRQSNHDFAAALADLDALIAARPDDAQALLTRAVVRQVQGDLVSAAGDCAAVVDAGAALAGTICALGVRALGPEAAGAGRDLADLDQTAGTTMQAGLRVWTLTLLAEIAARAGDAADADRRFRVALAVDPRDGYLLGAYADFLLDQDRPREVIALVGESVRIDPLLLRLALAERRLGLSQTDAHVADLAERFAASTARGETVHRREQARFTLDLLGQPQAALTLAAANWTVQREPADARLLLECAIAAKQPDAAAPVRAWLAATGLSDARLRRLAAEGGA